MIDWNDNDVEELNISAPTIQNQYNIFLYKEAIFFNHCIREKTDNGLKLYINDIIGENYPNKYIDCTFRISTTFLTQLVAPTYRTLAVIDEENTIIALYDITSYQFLQFEKKKGGYDVHIVAKKSPFTGFYKFNADNNTLEYRGTTYFNGKVTRIGQSTLMEERTTFFPIYMLYPFEINAEKTIAANGSYAIPQDFIYGKTTEKLSELSGQDYDNQYSFVAVFEDPNGSKIAAVIPKKEGNTFASESDFIFAESDFENIDTYYNEVEQVFARAYNTTIISSRDGRYSDTTIKCIKFYILPSLFLFGQEAGKSALAYFDINFVFKNTLTQGTFSCFLLLINQSSAFITVFLNNKRGDDVYKPYPFYVRPRLYLSGQTIDFPDSYFFKTNEEEYKGLIMRHSAYTLQLKAANDGAISITLSFPDKLEYIDVTNEFALSVATSTESAYLAQTEQSRSAQRTSGILSTILSVIGLGASIVTGNPAGIAASAVGLIGSATSLAQQEDLQKEKSNKAAVTAYGQTTGILSMVFDRKGKIFEVKVYEDKNKKSNILDIAENGYLVNADIEFISDLSVAATAATNLNTPCAVKMSSIDLGLGNFEQYYPSLAVLDNDSLEEFVDILFKGICRTFDYSYEAIAETIEERYTVLEYDS